MRESESTKFVHRFTLSTALLLVGLSAARVTAQCTPAAGVDFTKAVALLDDADGNTVYSVGDTVEYTVVLCNPSPGSCASRIDDDLNQLLTAGGVDDAHLDRVDCPGTAGCPADGGGKCWHTKRGDLGDPTKWLTAATEQCGYSCIGDPDVVAFSPLLGFPTPPRSSLAQNECFVFQICAMINGPITADECHCDVATTGTPAGILASHNPSWASLGSGTGCADAQTCPNPGTQCNTCYRVSGTPVAAPDLRITKTPASSSVATGGTVDFTIRIENLGGAPLPAGDLADVLAACWLPLGAAGSPCGPNVVCTGTGCGTGSCTYGAGGNGFDYVGWTLAARDGAPGGGDEITFTVTATAGPSPSPSCANTATTTDPDSSPFALATVAIVPAAAPDLRITKTAASPAVASGSTVDFTILIENIGGAPLTAGRLSDVLEPCWLPLGTELAPCGGNVVCAGAGCTGGTCTYGPGGLGFDYLAWTLTAADGSPGGPDEIRFTVTATAGPTTGSCGNSAETVDPDSFPVADARVEIVDPTLADLRITKTAAGPTVPAGTDIAFTIRIENLGGGAHTAGSLTDVLDACWLPLGPAAAPCGANVTCAGAGCTGSTCTYTGGGLGFDYVAWTLAATDGLPGGADELTFTVTVTAGPTTGPCSNFAVTEDPDARPADDDTVEITSPGICDLNAVNIDLNPVVPTRTGSWFYTLDCGPAPGRVDPTTPVRGFIAYVSDVPSTAIPSPAVTAAPGVPNTGILFQRGCACNDVIYLVRDTVANTILLVY